MAWSEAAREAAALARRMHAHQHAVKHANAIASHKPSTKAKQDIARQSEMMIAAQLRSEHYGKSAPVDVVVKRGAKLIGVEVKTLIDNKNDKITMHGESLARKVKWGHQNHAAMYTVVIDRRAGATHEYYRKGVGSFRLSTLIAVKNGANLRTVFGV